MKYIPLTNSDSKIIVDDDLYDVISAHNWYLNGAGYAGTSIGGKDVFLHRFIMGGEKGMEVDHINGNRFDCRRENMRFCTHSQNIANDGPRTNNKLGIKGVDWREPNKKFRATIRVNYKKIHLGLFDTAKEAAIAYNEASKKYYGEFAYQNNLESI